MNKNYRHQDKPTNVLSFPQTSEDMLDITQPFISLGDIIIAYETMKKEAEDQGKTFADHYSHMLVHGCLHLLHYDHQTDAQAQEMESLEIKILDDYIEEKKINIIDLIKIDTQGYEDKVLSGSKKILSSNNVGIIIAEIIFDNNYDRYLTFSDLEKYLIPNNFRLVAIDLKNNNIFSSYFMADVMYFNKDRFKI